MGKKVGDRGSGQGQGQGRGEEQGAGAGGRAGDRAGEQSQGLGTWWEIGMEYRVRGQGRGEGQRGSASTPWTTRTLLDRDQGGSLTLHQLPQVLDEPLAQQPVLVVALDHQVLLTQQAPPAELVGPQLRVLHLQLVRPAEQPQYLPLVLADGLRGQQPLQL